MRADLTTQAAVRLEAKRRRGADKIYNHFRIAQHRLPGREDAVIPKSRNLCGVGYWRCINYHFFYRKIAAGDLNIATIYALMRKLVLYFRKASDTKTEAFL